MPPYKKQIIADDVPQLKPFDYQRQLDAIASDMGQLSEKTAKMAQANFLNTFEIESRKALAESFDRNQNDPAALEKENNQIMTKFVSALPTKELREEAKLRFTVHAMGYMGKAKENAYNQQYKQLQASTLDKTNVLLNDIQYFGKDLYTDNLGISGSAAQSIGNDIVSLEQMLAQKDERGNMVLSPERQAHLRDEVRQRLTASDLDHFNGLETLKQKEKFLKDYKDKKTKKIWFDPEQENGWGEQAMNENNTDWPTYEKNLAAMERTLEVAKGEITKGMDQEDAAIFGVAKVKVMEELDTDIRNLDQDSKTNPFKVLAFLQKVNDYGHPSRGFEGRNGMRAPFLEPKEMYDYRKDVIKNYMEDVIKAIDKPADKTNFSYGMQTIKEFLKKNEASHGINDFDKADLLTHYYLQMIHSGVPEAAFQDRVSAGFNSEIVGAANEAIKAWVIGSTKFSEHEKNMISTMPQEIEKHFVAREKPLPGKILPIIKY